MLSIRTKCTQRVSESVHVKCWSDQWAVRVNLNHHDIPADRNCSTSRSLPQPRLDSAQSTQTRLCAQIYDSTPRGALSPRLEINRVMSGQNERTDDRERDRQADGRTDGRLRRVSNNTQSSSTSTSCPIGTDDDSYLGQATAVVNVSCNNDVLQAIGWSLARSNCIFVETQFEQFAVKLNRWRPVASWREQT